MYLHDLADVCRRTGFQVIEVEGWQERARGGSGGHDTNGYQTGKPNHVMCHHTASGASMDGWGDVNYMTFNHQDAPLCNLYIARNGAIYVCAGGATNTNGSGSDPCGTTSDDSMNSSAIGIEVGNNGVGEQYPDQQQDSYVALCRALCDAYIDGNYGRCHAHFEWAPTRKIDNAGNSRYANGSASWNMDQFRADVAASSTPEEGDLTPEQATQLAEVHTATAPAQISNDVWHQTVPDPTTGNETAMWAMVSETKRTLDWLVSRLQDQGII